MVKDKYLQSIAKNLVLLVIKIFNSLNLKI